MFSPFGNIKIISILEIQPGVLFFENCDYLKDHAHYKDYLVYNDSGICV